VLIELISNSTKESRDLLKPHRWLIQFIGVIVAAGCERIGNNSAKRSCTAIKAMSDSTQPPRFRFWLWVIQIIGVIVPRRLRRDWRQEWEAELCYREALLADWDNLIWKTKFDLLRRSLGAFSDALWLQSYRWEDEMIQDLRFGLRMLVKKPGFTFVAVLTMSLGIGAITAIFTVIDAALLRSLPYKDPGRLVQLWETRNAGEIKQLDASYPDYLDWGQQHEAFEGICGFTGWGGSFTLTDRAEPERIEGARVTATFFSVLGVDPVLGRAFLADEDKPGAAPTVILSHALWSRVFGADPAIVGQQIRLDGKGYTVLGVLPRSFQFAPMGTAELWTPLRPSEGQLSRRFMHWLDVIARLKPGVSMEQAQAQLTTIAASIERDNPDSHTGAGLRIVPLHDEIVGPVRSVLLVLMGAVGFVLLIACANVANLQLVRNSTRRKEIGIRLALGATQWRLMRQMISESVLLMLMGGGVGLLVALWGIKLLMAPIPAAQLASMPYLKGLALDARVFCFAGGLSLLTGIVFGLAAAWRLSSSDVQASLKDGGNSYSSLRRHGFRNMLAVSEIALALVLLVGAGLMIKSTARLLEVKLGFRPERLLTMQMALPSGRYAEDDQVRAFHQQLISRIEGLPGVDGAATVNWLPMQPGPGDLLLIEGEPPPTPGTEPKASTRVVSAGYFHTMGISLLKGREFTDRDNQTSSGVIAINNALARRLFALQDPIGRRITFAGDEPRPYEIVGVVDDERVGALDEESASIVYRPFAQEPWPKLALIVRTTGDPQGVVNAVRSELQELDHDVAPYAVATMEQTINDTPSTFLRRYPALLMTVFASLALILAAVGIYGVISYTVTQRTREIGIRMALGAKTSDVLTLILQQGMRVALIGVGAGLAASFALTRLLKTLLFDVSATDPLTYAGVAGLLLIVALMACYLPARRAARVQPLTAIRHD